MTRENFLLLLFDISGDDINHYFEAEKIVSQFNIEASTYKKYSAYWVDKGILNGGAQVWEYGHIVLNFTSYGVDYIENLLVEKKSEGHPNNIIQEHVEMIKFFISHSSEDIDLAKALVELFHSAFSLSKKEIRCSSVPGYKFDSGIDIDSAVKKEVRDSDVLIGLITPNSLQSSYVLFELGARWVLDGYLIPALANGSSFSDLPAPIQSKNSLLLDNEDDLNDLIENIQEKLQLSKEKTSSYRDEIAKVIAEASKKKLTKLLTAKKQQKNSIPSIEEKIKREANSRRIKDERKRILQTYEGVELARDEAQKFIIELQSLCKKNSYPSEQLVFNFNITNNIVDRWEGQFTSMHSSAYVEFSLPFSNSTVSEQNNKFTFIKLFIANYYLFSGYSREKSEFDKTNEIYFYFNIDNDKKGAWSKVNFGDEFISTEQLALNVFEIFYEFDQTYGKDNNYDDF